MMIIMMIMININCSFRHLHLFFLVFKSNFFHSIFCDYHTLVLIISLSPFFVFQSKHDSLVGEHDFIRSMSLLSDVALVTGNATDPQSFLFDIRTGATLRQFVQSATQSHPYSSALLYHPTTTVPKGFIILSSAQRNMIHAYHFLKDLPILKFTVQTQLSCVTTSKDGVWCAAGSESGHIYLWHV